MRNRLLETAALAACTLLMVSCAQLVTGSGNVVETRFDFKDFTEVECAHGFYVEIEPGDTYEVVVLCDDNIVPYIQCYKSESLLHLGADFGINLSSGTLKAKIIMPSIKGAGVSGGSAMTVKQGFERVQRFACDLSGGSKLAAFCEAEEVGVSMSGASEAALNGNSRKMLIRASGSSNLDGRKFTVRDVDVDASGSSVMRLNITGTINASMSGSSLLEYKGSALHGRTETSGSSKIIQLEK